MVAFIQKDYQQTVKQIERQLKQLQNVHKKELVQIESGTAEMMQKMVQSLFTQVRQRIQGHQGLMYKKDISNSFLDQVEIKYGFKFASRLKETLDKELNQIDDSVK